LRFDTATIDRLLHFYRRESRRNVDQDRQTPRRQYWPVANVQRS